MGACATGPASEPVPALRTGDDAAGRARLEAAAARLAGATRLTLAPTAFVDTAEVVVERAGLRSLEGVADGRTRTPPLRLRLERDADGCRLRDVASGAVERLPGIDCAPAP
jgi:hypothetical protein